MSCIYVTSDWHLGHKNIHRWEPNGLSLDERTGKLLENYLSVVNNRDIVWFLGDICFDLDAIKLIQKLPGDKRIVLGNHDIERGVPIEQYVLTFDQVWGMLAYKKSWLSHAPIHPNELRGKLNIHGHVHQNSLNDERYVNACPEVNEYKLLKYQDILEEKKETMSKYGKENISSCAAAQGCVQPDKESDKL